MQRCRPRLKVGMNRDFTVERVTRIELAWPAWKDSARPPEPTRMRLPFDLLAPRGIVIGSRLGPAKGPACGCCSFCSVRQPRYVSRCVRWSSITTPGAPKLPGSSSGGCRSDPSERHHIHNPATHAAAIQIVHHLLHLGRRYSVIGRSGVADMTDQMKVR
jgi:hypothetical protein